MTHNLHVLSPPSAALESIAVLKALAPAHRFPAELKGLTRSVPNEATLVNDPSSACSLMADAQ